MIKKELLNKAIKLMTASMTAIMVISSTAYGITKDPTPMNGWRYVNKKANYQVKSTSDKYKNIWAKATKEWTDNGFKWTEKSSSKTTLSSYEDDSKSGIGVAGYCTTKYRVWDGHIKKNKVMLNRAVFKKYDYTDSEIVNVAEHELGHALGLAHNDAGSISLMNPANRYYGIQGCDIRGMEKRYSTAISGDLVGGDDIVTVTEYFMIDIPEIKNVQVRYSSKKITITGKAARCKYVRGSYNGKNKTVKVKSDEFKLVFDYTKGKDIKISGLNSKKERISEYKTVKAQKYISEDPVCIEARHVDDGMEYSVQTAANSTLIFKYKGKTVKEFAVDSSSMNINIKESELKGKKGNFVVIQRENGKKSSKKVKFPILKKDEAIRTVY